MEQSIQKDIKMFANSLALWPNTTNWTNKQFHQYFGEDFESDRTIDKDEFFTGCEICAILGVQQTHPLCECVCFFKHCQMQAHHDIAWMRWRKLYQEVPDV